MWTNRNKELLLWLETSRCHTRLIDSERAHWLGWLHSFSLASIGRVALWPERGRNEWRREMARDRERKNEESNWRKHYTALQRVKDR